jgi:hypothetical protein
MASIESFKEFLAEYYVSASPGTVVVPGEWYKDNVNSVNYVAKRQPMPEVIDTMFEDNEMFKHLNSLVMDKDFDEMLAKGAKSKDVIEYIKNWLMQRSNS